MFTRGRGSRFVLAAVCGVVAPAACAKGGHSSGFDPPPESSDASSLAVVPPSSNDASAVRAVDGTDDGHLTLVFADAGSDAAAADGAGALCDAGVCDDALLAALCGDGTINGTEQCDDGNTTPGDGCSASCRLEPGFACVVQATAPSSVCHATTCGDGTKEGFEQCDDGNLIPYDGCSPTCTLEPKCNGTGGCTGLCGDGLVFPPEECDDGNTIAGDGCSATCTLEKGSGYACKNVSAPPAPTLSIPILYRDMLYHTTTAAMMPTPAPAGGGHPDFNYDPFNTGLQLGLVLSPLGADSEPVLNTVGVPQVITSATSFCWWYHDAGCGDAGGPNPYAKQVYLDAAGKPTTLTLLQTAAGSNVYTFASAAFFPIDGLGWNAGRNPQVDLGLAGTALHNFSFTSELHYVFTYDATVAASATPSVFSFTGDDDVWAFINGFNVVDLGGMHDPLVKMIPLDAITAAKLGLVDGGWYSIDLFQAERHVKGSDYSLTLSGFAHTVTQCQTACGDGVAAGTEQCDNGMANVPAASNPYGRGVCTDMCTLAPYCGDGIVEAQFGEKCDGTQNCGSDCQPMMPM